MNTYTAYDEGTFALAATVKKGEYVKRTAEARKVYQHAGYCRFNKAYQLDDCDDISRAIYVKGTVALFTGFTY